MEFDEQQKRKFAPIQSEFSEDLVKGYETYSTYLPYVDPLRLKSKYVISFDSYETDTNAALGDGIRNIDKACRYLSLAHTQDIRASINERVANFQPYLYQVVKIYKLDNDGNEEEFDFKLANRSVQFPRRPERNEWRDTNTAKFLEELADFHDETLERAIKYLYRSTIGLMILDSAEKRALDHFKSIEIIVNSLSTKREFSERLIEAKTLLNISDDDVKRINELWDERSTFGDIAHPSKFDQVERYPNQFPLPSNVGYTGLFDHVAGRLCLKYYDYKKSIYRVDIEKKSPTHLDGKLGVVNSGSESNHYIYFTNEASKSKLKKDIIAALAQELGVAESQIHSYELLRDNKSYGISIYARVRLSI